MIKGSIENRDDPLSKTQLDRLSKDLKILESEEIMEAFILFGPETSKCLHSSNHYPENLAKIGEAMIDEMVRREIDTNTLQQYLFVEPGNGGWGYFNETMIYLMGYHYPKEVWKFLKEHRAILAILANEREEGYWGEYYEISNAAFAGMGKRPDQIGREFLVEDSFDEIPYSDHLARSAMFVLAEISPGESALIDLLDWRVGKGSSLTVDGNHFMSPLNPYHRSTYDALKFLAGKNPRKAIEWAENNRKHLDFDWRLYVFIGWYRGSPDTGQGKQALEWYFRNPNLEPKNYDRFCENVIWGNADALNTLDTWLAEEGMSFDEEIYKEDIREQRKQL